MSGRSKRHHKQTPRHGGRSTPSGDIAMITEGRPLRVTVQAATEVARATQEQQLTTEEKEQLKTRTRYRLYQRNHRAKKQRCLEALQGLVAVIQAEISELEKHKKKSQHCSAHQGVEVFVNAVSTFVCFPEGDTRRMRGRQQISLCDLVKEGGSVWTAVHQWKQLCGGFHVWKLELEHFVDTVDCTKEEDVSFVSCCLVLTVEGSMDHFKRILPALHATRLYPVAIKLAEQRQLQVPGRGVFVVTASGLIHAISMDFDFVRVLTANLEEPLAVVASVLATTIPSKRAGGFFR